MGEEQCAGISEKLLPKCRTLNFQVSCVVIEMEVMEVKIGLGGTDKRDREGFYHLLLRLPGFLSSFYASG